jgi:hypothetical protein
MRRIKLGAAIAAITAVAAVSTPGIASAAPAKGTGGSVLKEAACGVAVEVHNGLAVVEGAAGGPESALGGVIQQVREGIFHAGQAAGC